MQLLTQVFKMHYTSGPQLLGPRKYKMYTGGDTTRFLGMR